MTAFVDEAQVEMAFVELLRELGYEYAFGPDIACDGFRAKGIRYNGSERPSPSLLPALQLEIREFGEDDEPVATRSVSPAREQVFDCFTCDFRNNRRGLGKTGYCGK